MAACSRVRFGPVLLAWLILLAGTAVADDFEVTLAPGDDFVVRDFGFSDRWQIDEGGDLFRSGSLFLHGGVTNGGVAIGAGALDSQSSGNDNTAIGGNALGILSSGSDNVSIGDYSGSSLSSGSNNVYIGNDASESSSESRQIRIGESIFIVGTIIAGQVDLLNAPDVSLSGDGALMLGSKTGYNIAIDGNEIQARYNGSSSTICANCDHGGTVVLGRAGKPGGVQIPWVNPSSTVKTDGSSLLYGQASTRRRKQSLQPFEDDYSKILRLRAQTFEYVDDDRFPSGRFLGYMAEDVHDAGMEHLVRYDEDGLPVNINYDQFSIYLVELLRKHEATLAARTRVIQAQEREIEQQLQQRRELERRLERMEVRVSEWAGGSR